MLTEGGQGQQAGLRREGEQGGFGEHSSGNRFSYGLFCQDEPNPTFFFHPEILKGERRAFPSVATAYREGLVPPKRK